MKQIVIMLISILPFGLYGINYSVGDTLNVVAFDGLALRSKPSTESTKLAILGTQEKVVVMDTSVLSLTKDTIFGFPGGWVLIQAENEEQGYVFDAFLSTLPVAKSFSEVKKSIPDNSFDFSQWLPGLKTIRLTSFWNTIRFIIL